MTEVTSDCRRTVIALASSDPNDSNAETLFQNVAQATYNDSTYRVKLASSSTSATNEQSCVAFEAVDACKYPENYDDLVTILSIGLLAEIQEGDNNPSNNNNNTEVCTALASAICHAASQRIITANEDPDLNLDTGYVSRDALWLLNDVASVIRNEFSNKSDNASRAMTPVSHSSMSSAGRNKGIVMESEMERLLNLFLDVSEGGNPLCDVTQFIYPTALSLCVLLSISTFSMNQPTVAMEYRENASSIMSRRLFAGKHSSTTTTASTASVSSSTTPRSTASPIEVQLCSPVIAIMTQQSFDKFMARPMQFKLLSERTSTVETTLAMVLSLIDAPLWQSEMKLEPPNNDIGPLNLVVHYDSPTNIASAAVRTLSLSETARLGEDLIFALMKYASLLKNGRVMFQSAQSLVQCINETLAKALLDFEREHDNHDEILYENIFLALEGVGQIFAEVTSTDDMLGQIPISHERELAADVIRAVEAVSNNPDVPLQESTHDVAERALDEWEVVYKRRDGLDDGMFITSSSPEEEEEEALMSAHEARDNTISPSPLEQQQQQQQHPQIGAVAVSASESDLKGNDPQARKMAAFGASSVLHEHGSTSPAPPPPSRPGASHVTSSSMNASDADNPQARKMAAFGASNAAAINSFSTASTTNKMEKRPESALSRGSVDEHKEPESLMERARAKIAEEEHKALLNKDEAEKKLYGNDLKMDNGGKKVYSTSAAAEAATTVGDKKFDLLGGSEDHSLPPAEFYGEGLIDGGKGDGVVQDGGLAVAVPINEAEEEKFITAAEEFNPDDRVPIWKNPRFILGLALCFLVVIVIAIVVSIVVSRKVVESSETPVQTQRDTMGFWEQFEAVSGPIVRQEGSPQYLAGQYIVNVDARELSPDDPLLLQRYTLALLFTAYDGWQWKWCGGVQSNETCKYPCWNENLDCAVSKCSLYGIERSLTSQFAGECSASRFLESSHECDWYGVECEENYNGDRVVTELYLKSNNLNGTFVSEIGLLNSLKHLSLQDNSVKGNMSESIGNLNQLETLFLHANEMTGELPQTLYNLNGTLSDLDISANQFSGSLSSSWGQFISLDGFKIFNNTFSGPLPNEIYDMTNVQVFNIRGNNFTGPISEDIGKLTRLRELNLQYNQFTGEVPKSIGQLTYLSEFQINNNDLKGSIPEEVYDSISLKNLYLHNNFFTGTLSERIGNLKLLEKVVVNNNEFNGPLPQGLGELPRLDTLWVHFNQFEGQMPEAVCSRRLEMDEPSSLYADCFGTDAAVSCDGSCCTHCCHNEIFYCFAS